jgi:RimJ/RimL family protein N-acetyltransferase
VTVVDPERRTDRLLLRRFRDSDREAFADLNSDPAVMATLAAPMTRDESDAFLDRIEANWDERGFGLWCVDLDGECLGFTGLTVPWFRDGVEVGWRIRSAYWGHGYAPEAGRAALAAGFDQLGLDEIISFTAVTNHTSRRVMDKIGLRYDPEGDFDHPSVPEGNPLRPHVLYRLDAAGYRARS